MVQFLVHTLGAHFVYSRCQVAKDRCTPALGSKMSTGYGFTDKLGIFAILTTTMNKYLLSSPIWHCTIQEVVAPQIAQRGHRIYLQTPSPYNGFLSHTGLHTPRTGPDGHTEKFTPGKKSSPAKQQIIKLLKLKQKLLPTTSSYNKTSKF